MTGTRGSMRGSGVWLLLSACLAVLSLMKEKAQAFTTPRAIQPAASSSQRQPTRTTNKRLCGRNVRAVAQQMALPQRRIGTSTPGSQRRGRFFRKVPNMKASFTSMVADLAMNPRVLIGEIAVVVLFSGIFEKVEHKIRHKLARSGRETASQILTALFNEITVLGFVAFSIFTMTHTGVADVLAPKILRDNSFKVDGHNALSFTFETVHMMIFALLLVLLAQAAVMYYVSEKICDRWGGFERTVSYGNARATLESKFVETGYLKREPDSESSTGMKLTEVKPFAYGGNWIQRLLMRGRPLHKLLMWRAIRHEFLFPNDSQVEDGKWASRVPDPSLFSFQEYLRNRLGKVVLSLIHLDRWTWIVTLGLLSIPLYICKTYPTVSAEMIHCIMAWMIAGLSMVLAVFLERDMFKLTPKVPQKVQDILKLFSGESYQMLRRSKIPGWADRPLQYDEEFTKTPLDLPEAMKNQKKSKLMSSKSYTSLFKLLTFFQAVSVTSLILSHLTSPFTSRAEWAWYLAAFLEWPFFLFVVVPVIIRRLTIRSSIGLQKDDRLIRKVTTETKESLLRDYARLVQILGYAKRSSEAKQEWTISDGTWDSKKAIQTVLTGLKKFDNMPPTEKREIWAIFAAWDSSSQGFAETREFEEAFHSMGSPRAKEVVDNLVRLVDFDGSKTINWMKFKALYGLATADEQREDMREDFKDAFKFLDTDGSGELSIFELAKGFEKMNIGIGIDDMANLLFLHFGIAKPTITMDEFVEWIVADRTSTLGLAE